MLMQWQNNKTIKEVIFFGYDKKELMGIGIRPWVIKFRTKDGKQSIKLSTLSLDTILNKLYV